MYTVEAENVNDAYVQCWALLHKVGVPQQTRAGEVLALQRPLAVTYKNPTHRVLYGKERDANPFFHLFEALWLLAGRNDAKWLDQFVHDFSSRFAESDGQLHGSYGFRWRRHFDVDGGGSSNVPDQLDTVVRLLKANPDDRRVVLQMWDAVADLGQAKSDTPCNLMALPRIRQIVGEPEPGGGKPLVRSVLDLTVYNRSNDITWGLAGANAVQFSMLLEYLAGRIGVGVGEYVQISNNAHLYKAHQAKYAPSPLAHYPLPTAIGKKWDVWDVDLASFLQWTESWDSVDFKCETNPWFEQTAKPLYKAHALWKLGHKGVALAVLMDTQYPDISLDWWGAAVEWVQRRMLRKS